MANSYSNIPSAPIKGEQSRGQFLLRNLKSPSAKMKRRR
jgi:hypothetical protein